MKGLKKEVTNFMGKVEGEDSARLSNTATQHLTEQKQLKKKTKPYQFFSGGRKAAEKELFSYSNSLAAYVLSKSPKEKQELEKSKKRLLQGGITTRQLGEMEGKMSKVVFQQAYSHLRKQLVKQGLSGTGSMVEQYLSGMGSKHLLTQFLYDSSLLGVTKGKSLRADLEGEDYKHSRFKLRSEVGRELRMFLFDEASAQLSKALLGNKQGAEQLDQLVRAIKKSKTPYNATDLKNSMHNMIVHMGLEHFVPPESGGSVDYSDDRGDERGREQKEPVYLSPQDQLEDEIRILFMKQALQPGFRSTISTYLQTRHYAKQLKNLGYQDENVLKQMKKEGELLARSELLEELNASFIEEATLAELKGPTYKLIVKNRRYILKRLIKLGGKPSKTLYHKIRDDAHLKVFDVVKEQLHLLEMEQSQLPIQKLRLKRRELSRIIERIQKVTPLPDNLVIPGLAMEGYLSDSSITEAV
ncbi:MAG: hypothetical protein HRT90_01255 [Candidatus Margulisbacteria bacterium]|nr:hypothetical protein [Candidatus Margulisiibacteriota bacterium]